MISKLTQGMAPLANPETVEVLALNEPRLFHMAVGSSYRVGTKWDYEDLLPNPLGGEPFPSKAFFLLREVKQDERIAVVEWQQSLDPEKTRDILLQTLTAMAQRMNTPLPKPDQLPLILIDDVSDSSVDLDTGWPVTVVYERNMKMGDRTRVDRMEFRMISGN